MIIVWYFCSTFRFPGVWCQDAKSGIFSCSAAPFIMGELRIVAEQCVRMFIVCMLSIIGYIVGLRVLS